MRHLIALAIFVLVTSVAHAEPKEYEDTTTNFGVKAVVPIKDMNSSSLELSYRKDMNQTNMAEGHSFNVMFVKEFKGISLNPLKLLKKD